MPRIENFKLKTNYRAWDNDILSKLKLPDEKITGHYTEKKEEIGNKPTTNRQQTGNNLATNRQHSNQQKKQTGNKLGTQPTTQLATNWQQTGNKLATNLVFSSLVGLQRSVAVFIYYACKSARSKITEPMTLEHISKSLQTSCGCIKTTIQRLEYKNLVQRKEYKNGRGGWSKYGISDSLFQELLHLETDNKLTINWQQTGNKLGTQPTTQPATIASSSSGILFNNKNTTTSEYDPVLENQSLQDEWQQLDISPLNGIGFTKTHLSQIASQNKLTPEVVQDSINAFSFDLLNNDKEKKIKGDVINFFMGIMRNGKPYTPPSNYESPKDAAMRAYLDRKREIEKKRAEQEAELFDFSFNDWFKVISDDEAKKLLPEGVAVKYRRESPFILGSIKEYFKNEVWPEKLKEIIK